MSLVESELRYKATQNYSVLTGENMANAPSNYINFTEIENHSILAHGDVNNTYGAISRDLVTYILDKDYNDDALQVASIYPLSEDFDNPITVAVLATTYDGKTTESQYAKLYVVTAEYDEETWELININVEDKESISMYKYPRLQNSGFDATKKNLYQFLLYQVQEINSTFNISLPEPLLKKEPLSGVYTNLGMASGVARFANVMRYIRCEEDSGCQILPWYVEDNPTRLSDGAFSQAILNADWTEVAEGEEGRPYSLTEVGFVGFGVNLYLENENGLHAFHFMFDSLKSRAILRLTIEGERSKYYVAQSEELISSIIDVFSIRTDVTEYMITDEKGPTLPGYREELKHLVPIVGDMPGGILSIETSVSETLELRGYKSTEILDEDDVVFWAISLGRALDEYGISDISQIPITENPDIAWNVELAAHEGVGSLHIIGFADTGTIYIRKTFRIYGSQSAFEQYYICENREIFDLLCKLSFGETIAE